MFLILSVSVVLLALYIFVIRTWTYFSVRKVKFERGLPVLGSLGSVMLGRTIFVEELLRIYKKFPNDRFVGLYEIGGKPSVMIRDPELIKAISIKDFDSFVNHNFHLDADIDPLMSRVLITSNDQKWRDMRSILSPLFTGSKMRMMLSLMTDSIDDFTSAIRRDINRKNPKGGAVEYNMLDVLSAVANDVIATCAFGIRTNALEEENNEFFAAGKSIAYAVQSFKVLATSAMPKLATFLKVKMIDKKVDEFFRDIVRNSIQQRKEHKIVRNDMIQLMLLAQQGDLDLKEKDELEDAGFATISEVISARSAEKLRAVTEDDFVAQCLIFFLAGFTVIAHSLSFLCHELALNTNIQDRLRQEIDETDESLSGGRVTYEALQNMTYLDQVISEVLRKWPVAFFLDRKVNKEYTLENVDGARLTLYPDDVVWLSPYVFHRDAIYYPNPDKFDPERFSAENRKSIVSGTYFPFGLGPRACIASRFGLMELKATVYHLLQNFYLECSPKTDVSLKLKPGVFAMVADKGFWLQLKLRNK